MAGRKGNIMNKNTQSILCLPTRAHIPTPQHQDWKMIACPVCGKDCWESDLARKAKKQNPKLKSACTDCALKIGFK